MSHPRFQPSFSAASRPELRLKVDTLITVLELALRKISSSLARPGADTIRLTRIRRNLEGSLQVCRRARSSLADPKSALARRMNYREYVEMASFAEFCRFRDLGPVTEDELAAVDFAALCRSLSRCA